jgi:hypothetical protein
MVKEELIEKSPIRVLEKSIHGGLKKGNLGVIASRKGVGKTAVLVQIALDELLQGKHVIHVSFKAHSSHVVDWYEDLFEEVARKRKLEHMRDVHDEIVKNRVLMNFSQDGIGADQLRRSLSAMIREGGFKADCIIVDGFDFSRGDTAHIKTIKEFARTESVEVWYSCTLPPSGGEKSKEGVPLILKDYMDSIDVLISLDPMPDCIHFSVLKDHDRINPEDLKLKLDPKTLLIASA